LFVTLFGLGIRATRPELGIDCVHAQESSTTAAKDDGQTVQWTDSVQSDPQLTEPKAIDDALVKAQGRLTKWLDGRYPELKWSPTPKFIRKNLVKGPATPTTKFFEPAEKDMVTVTLNLELTTQNLKKIVQEDHNYRIEGRLWDLGRIVGGVVLLLGALAGCIRLDEWTKGYLTWPLRLGTAALAISGAFVLWFVI
jgi:hypothetical protein